MINHVTFSLMQSWTPINRTWQARNFGTKVIDTVLVPHACTYARKSGTQSACVIPIPEGSLAGCASEFKSTFILRV